VSFLKSFVKTAGKGIKGAAKVGGYVTLVTPTAKVSKVASKHLKKVPVVGKPLSAVVNLYTAPQQLAQRIISGERIDKATLNSLRQSVRDVREVAPYVQLVISTVPGIGTGMSAGLAAGLALAEGQPITAAIQAGVLGAIPGGAVAKSVASVSLDIAQKKPLNVVVLNALPLPADQKAAVQIVAKGLGEIAQGKSPNKVAIAAAEQKLPKDLRDAIAIGTAVGYCSTAQKAKQEKVSPAILKTLQVNGKAVLAVNSTMRAGQQTLKTVAQKTGFEVGTAMTRFKVSPIEATVIRGKLNAEQKKGFDLAAAAHIGAASAKPPPAAQTAAAKFAFNATVGAQALAAPAQNLIVTGLANDASTRTGVQLAVTAAPLQKKSFWRRVLIALGLAS
jgi:hypothetical protein